MKPVKYSINDANKIDLGTKVILKYPTPSDKYDIGHMTVKGRFPKGNTLNINSVCDFFVYITKSKGKVYAGDDTYEVEVGDVVYVPKGNKYAVEGEFEYVTIDIPAFYPEQSQET